ncbi:YkgJ family cysteine cluster protein [Methylomonas sp. MO1]|uniref:YkgJ family cysteine cluster protein n=1 Tax=Methylomonas sp. MO1 TaxID=3073619 RepID=UPI0028A2E6F5|nr:YkgJ family cysteine cluster protein [Methylomonas sp. MO1]MDT4290747.1 YkgJ family cysteine cluster protein [Methylomonas sp. MO1]
MNTLTQLQTDINTRVKTIRDGQPDWLCRQGCDGCCRRLAAVPKITEEEWRCLQEGLMALPPEQLQEVGRAIAALAGQTSRPIICPLLDQAKGACLVYAHRPVACRTYGFYVQRDQGLYCKDIESLVTDGALNEVVWGNHDGIDHRLLALGESRELPEWFADWSLADLK